MIAALSGWHEEHHAALAAVSDVDRLPAHVLLESASVLTRLPGGLPQPLSKVLDALQHSFPGRLLTLPEPEHRAFVRRLAAADLGGGALCDGWWGQRPATTAPRCSRWTGGREPPTLPSASRWWRSTSEAAVVSGPGPG
ncbi:MAG: hypothetical protein ACR2KP_05615 [Egibacteraceae bacterium]